MSHYIHHIPGRLRIKSPLLKHNETEAARAGHLLTGHRGVLAHEVRLRTGSLIIYYDTALVEGHVIVALLMEHGFIAIGHILSHPKDAVARFGTGLGEAIGKVVFSLAMEKLVERSALVLFKAIL